MYQTRYTEALERKAYRDASEALNQIAYLHWERNQYKATIDYYQRSIEENKKVGNQAGIGRIRNNLGMLFADIGEYQTSVDAFEEALTLRRRLGDRAGQLDPLVNQAVSYQKIPGKNAEAIATIRKALTIALELQDLDRVRLCYGMLSEMYQKENQPDSAFAYFELYRTFFEKSQETKIDALQEEAQQATLAAQIERLQRQKQQLDMEIQQQLLQKQQRQLAAYDSTAEQLYQNLSRQELAIRLLEEQNLRTEQAKAEALAHERRIRWVGISFTIVVLLVALLLWRAYQIKRKSNAELSEKNQLIQHQKEELQTANDQLTQLGQFKQRMTDMIAHDLKTPLSIIIGYTAHERDPRLRMIYQSGQQMHRLVNNMLDVQRFEEAKMPLLVGKVRLHTLIRDAVGQVEPWLEKKNIQILHPNLPDVWAEVDPSLIVRVLINLFTNAIKYSPTNAQIRVQAETVGTKIKVSISDQGKGIDPRDVQTIFMPFGQGQNAIQLGSTGIGLTFCKLAIETHGGTIGVNPQKDTEGSTFWFTLPLVALADQSDVLPDTAPTVAIQPEDVIARLSPADLDDLQDFFAQLAVLEVFQSSKINTILSRLDEAEVSEGIGLWLQELRKSVFGINETNYYALTHIARDNTAGKPNKPSKNPV